MTYVIVKDRQTIIGSLHATFVMALDQANEQFGDCANAWMKTQSACRRESATV